MKLDTNDNGTVTEHFDAIDESIRREGGREGVDACRPFEPFNINPISTIDLYKSKNIVLHVSFRIIV